MAAVSFRGSLDFFVTPASFAFPLLCFSAVPKAPHCTPRRTAERLRLSPDELGACSARGGAWPKGGGVAKGRGQRGGAWSRRGGVARGGRRIVRGGGGGAAMERWTGRVALVTGASVGIGAAVARALVQHGMKVVGCARSVDKIEVAGRGRAVRLREGRGGSDSGASLGPVRGGIGARAPAVPHREAFPSGTGRGRRAERPRSGASPGAAGSCRGAVGAARAAEPAPFPEQHLSGRAHPAGSGPGWAAFKGTRSGARRVSRASLTLE